MACTSTRGPFGESKDVEGTEYGLFEKEACSCLFMVALPLKTFLREMDPGSRSTLNALDSVGMMSSNDTISLWLRFRWVCSERVGVDECHVDDVSALL